MSSTSVPDPAPPSASDRAMRDLLRELWVHEDNLLNHRVTWLVTSEGLLLTAFGIFLQVPSTAWSFLAACTLQQWFPWIGILLSACFAFGIFAAHSAMGDIQERYFRKNFDDNTLPLYPGKSRIGAGQLVSKIIPFLFFAVWIAVIIVTDTAPKCSSYGAGCANSTLPHSSSATINPSAAASR